VDFSNWLPKDWTPSKDPCGKKALHPSGHILTCVDNAGHADVGHFCFIDGQRYYFGEDAPTTNTNRPRATAYNAADTLAFFRGVFRFLDWMRIHDDSV
jgi:hypothetical protein